jgi:ubiquinone biosynthesis protein UbiJ
MQSTENLQNKISSSIKEKVNSSKIEQQLPKSRGEVAAQEQVRILRQAMTASKAQPPQVPQSRGQVAAQEQVRILNEVTATSKVEARLAQSRGDVAAQEQVRILRQAMRM